MVKSQQLLKVDRKNVFTELVLIHLLYSLYPSQGRESGLEPSPAWAGREADDSGQVASPSPG